MSAAATRTDLSKRLKIAFVVSHPIQYYAPLHQRLARRSDISVKVFFTWHAGEKAVADRGFGRAVAWDIPLTTGYDSELVPNRSADPGTHHFWGLRNPGLVDRVKAWNPDAVHITGWAWRSHLGAIRAFSGMHIPILFRGDSHLLDEHSGPRRHIKRALLRRVYDWPAAFLFVGSANRAYYQSFGVEQDRLFPCPHSVEVGRFAGPNEAFDRDAVEWRRQLGIPTNATLLLFAGKFELKKQPVELMRAFQALGLKNCVLVMVGNGELQEQVDAIAQSDPSRFRILPFQNQSRMPVVYRLCDLFVLPSAYSESWGLAVNEAMACGRPVLVSDRVGCAADVVTPDCGKIFSVNRPGDLVGSLTEMTRDKDRLSEMGRAAAKRAWQFDIAQTESSLVKAVYQVCSR